MDLSHNIVLNEEVLKSLSDQKKPIFVFEWLRFVERSLLSAQKVVNEIVCFADHNPLHISLVDRHKRLPEEADGPTVSSNATVFRTSDSSPNCQMFVNIVFRGRHFSLV